MRTSQPAASTNNTGAHGLGTGLAAQRLPVAPRERKPALAALAVLLILGGALISGYLVIDSGKRVSAIKIVAPVAAGELIPESALAEVQIGKTGIDYVPWAQRSQVARAYAAVGLVPGALLTQSMATDAKDTLKGRVIVGLALKPAQLPAEGLRTGATVAVFAVAGRTESATVRPGTLLASDALVREVVSAFSKNGGSTSGETRVSVAVTPDQAGAIAQAASAGSVVVVLVPPGVTMPEVKPLTPPTKSTAPKPGG